MKKLDLKIAKKEDRDLWDRIVRENNGTLFHSWDFLKIMEKHSRFGIIKQNKLELLPLIGFESDNPIGIFPIFLYNKFPRYIFSPPPGTESFYLGPIFSGLDEQRQHKKESYLHGFYNEINNYFTTLSPQGIKIKSKTNIEDQRCLKYFGYKVEPMYDYVIDLGEGLNEIWNGFHSSIRKNIRKAENDGIVIEESGLEGLEFIYESVYERYSQQKEHMTYSKDYLINIFEKFYPDNFKVIVAKIDGEMIGGSINICFNKEVSVWIGGFKSTRADVKPNELLFWEMMKWARDNGYERFRIPWANDMRLNKYKSQYNPNIELYYIISKSTMLISFLHMIRSELTKR